MSSPTPHPTSAWGPDGLRLDLRELAGAVADLGVLVPIAVALVLVNGLSASAVLLPAGLLALVAGFVYRVPVPVQPLKAFGAIAVAKGLGPDVVAAGALLMGVTFALLGSTGLVDRAARLVPTAVVRGVQLTVGVLLLRLAWGLVTHPPRSFVDDGLDAPVAVTVTVVLAVLAYLFRRWGASLVLVAGATVAMVIGSHGPVPLGPSTIRPPALTIDAAAIALVALVLPQLPLTFANSCVATADVAKRYFGAGARRVTPGRLAISLGAANLLAGAIGGMPVCHGAGGMTAHRSFGARSGGAPVVLGAGLLAAAVGLGAALPELLARFPVTVLGALLGVAGVLHVTLLRDLGSNRDRAIALGVGAVGILGNLAVALVLGILAWWALERRTGRITR